MSIPTKVAIVGFLPEDEKQIHKLAAAASGSNIAWASAKDGGLTGVIFNAKFVQTPTIQKFISITKANVACCYKNIVDLVEAKALNIPALSLDASDQTEIQAFFDSVTKQSQEFVPQEEVREMDGERPQYDTKVLSSVLELIQKRAGYLAAESANGETWVDPIKQEVYLNYSRNEILPIESMDWREVTSFTPPSNFAKMQLDLWLFEAIWNSTEDYASLVKRNQRYRMSRWPQPLKKEGRTEALRLAASLLGQPMGAQELQEATEYPMSMVNRFIYAGFAAGQIKKVASTEPMPEKVEKRELSEQEKRINEEKLSIVRRIRQKFGF